MDRVAARLVLSYLAVVATGLIVSSLLIGGLLVRSENAAARERLAGLEQTLFTAVQNGLRQGRPTRDVVASITEQARAVDARLLVIATQTRRVLVDSEGRLEGRTLAETPSGDPEIFTFRDQDEDWLYVQRALGPAGTLVVARPRTAIGDTLRQILPSILIGALAGAALALALALLFARTITRPVSDLVAGARRFASGDMRARVALGGPHEVRDLGRAFNDMASEVERARGAERAFLADLSHELRTPLTSIHGFAQAIVDGEVQADGIGWAARTIQREARRLIRMVEGLLQIARIESGAAQEGRETVPLGDVLRAAVAALDVQAREADVTIRPTLGELPPVSGDPDRLSQLFINVLDNAVKHSPKGASVDLGAAARNGEVVVRVRDNGGGIPTGAETRVFERFYRGEGVGREGTGLGLAIAQAIAESHGGHIEASNVEGGAEFRVVLPVAHVP